jgi:hypothetical protein
LVFPPRRPEGIVAKAVYVFRVLEQFHRHLSRHDIFATSPQRWADPRAQLLTGEAWEAAKSPALNALGLPDVNGQVVVPAGGQVKVPTPRVDQLLLAAPSWRVRASRMR